jgi:acyl phosphate:glycerol-3-phosphate acyltransferase
LLALLYVGAFLLGSIPVGYLAAKAKGIDIRTVGSGNIGATNVNRALGSKWGIAVFVLDVLKGLIPVLVARELIPQAMNGVVPQLWWIGAGACALLGHMFSPWLGFKGGKGIATGLGMVLGTAPMVAGICFAIFLGFMIPTRYVSLSSIIGVIALPFVGWFVPGEPRELVPLYILLTLFVIWKHRDNIKRLRDGTESKFTFKK